MDLDEINHVLGQALSIYRLWKQVSDDSKLDFVGLVRHILTVADFLVKNQVYNN